MCRCLRLTLKNNNKIGINKYAESISNKFFYYKKALVNSKYIVNCQLWAVD